MGKLNLEPLTFWYFKSEVFLPHVRLFSLRVLDAWTRLDSKVTLALTNLTHTLT